ncbi:MAG: S24 family peptidase [Nitrospinota bacterium]
MPKKVTVRSRIHLPEFGRYLAGLRRRQGLSQKEAAKLLGEGGASIASYEAGYVGDPGVKFLRAAARLYHVPLAQMIQKLIEEKYGPQALHTPPSIPLSEDGRYRSIPIVTDPIAAGAGVEVVDALVEDYAVIYREWLPPGRCVCVRVAGDSMEPTLPDGSIVAIALDERVLQDGKVFAFYDREVGGAILKRALAARGRQRVWLIVSDNPDRKRYPVLAYDEERFFIAGRASWAWKTFE